GNPGSAYAVFALLVSPLIRTMQGRANVLPPTQYGTLNSQTSFNGTREEFLRVQASHTEQCTALTPHSLQGSGIISSLSWATGFARIPPNTTIGHGDVVRYYDCRHWLV
ncbi:MAG TPA: molybdopterin molybdenumtransferase MoeA, partial [Eoetvoesiella sp.]